MALQLVTSNAQSMTSAQPFNNTEVSPKGEDKWTIVNSYPSTGKTGFMQAHGMIPPDEKIHYIQMTKIMNLPQQSRVFKPVKKDFKMKKNNQRSRRHHNIHQPGGADCSQRR